VRNALGDGGRHFTSNVHAIPVSDHGNGFRWSRLEHPPTGLSNPDAADSSPNLNLALYSCESGADKAR
jgi:hypothetical protein